MAEMIYVGCKMPNGVVLNLTSYEVINKEHGLIRRVGNEHPTVTLKGNAFKEGTPNLSIDGYVFTAVPKDFWDAWLASHADSSLIKDGFIKPAKSQNDTKAVAREFSDEPGQNERITENDKRVRNLGVAKFQMDEAA